MEQLARFRMTVSRPFWELMHTEVPGLGKHESYRRLLAWLVFGARDKATGGVIVGRSVLAECEGKSADLRNHRYNASDLLLTYRDDVAPIEWLPYDARGKRARIVIDDGLSPVLRQAIAVERATKAVNLQDRCYWLDGRPFTAKRQRAARHDDYTDAEMITHERFKNAGCDEVRALLTYLNNMGSGRFTSMAKRHLDAAYATAAAIPSLPRRERAYNVLRAVADQPQQFYVPSHKMRTVRAFGANPGLPHLPREVRIPLLQDYVPVDLAAAQLAIVAQQWTVPSVQQFLEEHSATGRNRWATLCQAMGLDYTPTYKRACKDLLYGLCFGGGIGKGDALERNARAYVEDNAPALVERFTQIPMITDLLAARAHAAAIVKRNGGGVDCFGNWIPLERAYKGTEEYENASSVLACQAQAMELKLLWPVVERAMGSPDVDIVCWLFDGCSLAFKDRHKQGRILKQLQASVAAGAKQHAILTALEVGG